MNTSMGLLLLRNKLGLRLLGSNSLSIRLLFIFLYLPLLNRTSPLSVPILLLYLR